MKKQYFLQTTIILILALFGTGCGKNNAQPSVSSISGLWLEIKRDLNSPELDSIKLLSQINDFHITLNRFSDSSVSTLYRIHRPKEMQSIANIDSAVDQLKVAIQQGNVPFILSITLEIDADIDQLQLIDNNLAAASQLNYFQLFFFFSLLIIGIILGLWILFRRLEKAETREQQTLAFSRETITAQEQERSRIAKELHDTVAQDLWRLSFQTDMIDKIHDPVKRSSLCAEVSSGQKDLMRRIRNICDNLIPPDFLRRSLGDSLHSLCYKFAQSTGIECQVTIQEGLVGMNSDTQLQCYRIVQECLANIEKHAHATEVSVLARINTQGELIICVSDNGKGFSAPDRDSCQLLQAEGHFGLWSMYERAAALNGALSIDSEAGEGAVVTLRIQLVAISEINIARG